MNGTAGLYRAGEQPGVEGAHVAAVGRGALRENQQVAALGEVVGQLLIDLRGIAGAAADEQRASLACQPAQHGPACDFGLGQERQRPQHSQQRDIAPGNMVGDPQHWLRW